MAQRSGPGDQIYSLVGEGLVLIAPKGTPPEDIEAEATDYHVISWEGNEDAEDRPVTNTSDYNATTKLMNPRSLKTGTRITGVLHFHHNANPALDVLKNLPVGFYYVIRLYITEGQLSGTGDPAINRCYFDLTEANVGPRNMGGGDVNDPRPVDVSFMSNGIYTYVSEAVPVGP